MKGDEVINPNHRIQGGGYLKQNLPCMDKEMIDGYDLVAEGLEKASKKSYVEAAEMLRQGIEKSFEAAQRHGGDMEWMVQAHQSLADSLLNANSKEKDFDGAMEAIQAAILLAPEDELSYAILAGICEAKNDKDGEFKALQAMFDLPGVEDTMNVDREVSIRRQNLKFRFQQLQL